MYGCDSSGKGEAPGGGGGGGSKGNNHHKGGGGGADSSSARGSRGSNEHILSNGHDVSKAEDVADLSKTSESNVADMELTPFNASFTNIEIQQ